MKLRIKKGLFSWRIIDDSGAIVASISKKKLLSSSKKIEDSQGNTIFTTSIVNLPAEKKDWNCAEARRYIIYKDREPVATAKFAYARKPERTILQAFMLRPPQVDRMNVETPYGLWVIKRQKNNSLTITEKDEVIGTVTPFFSMKPKYLNHNGKYEATFLAGIYMLIEYMMQEDDLITV